MLDHAMFAALCHGLGVRNKDGQRLDAGETAFLAKQLEYVLSKTFDIKYPAFLGRKFIPINTEVPSGANSYTYYQWDEYGMAEIIANFADDLPMVGRFAKEFNAPIRSIGEAYMYSLQDLRASAHTGVPLDKDRAAVARRIMEQKVDALLATGDANAGLKGFLNHTNVPLTALTTGSWASATAAQILADLRKVQTAILVATKQIFPPDTMLLDTGSFDQLSNMEMSTDNSATVLETFLKNSPHIKNIDQWWKLDLADAAGTGPRLVMYSRTSEVVEGVIPQEFEQMPPQAVNLAFKVPCHMRHGGISIKYPLAMSYADGM